VDLFRLGGRSGGKLSESDWANFLRVLLGSKNTPPHTHNLSVIASQSGLYREIEHRIEPVVALEERNDKSGFLREIIRSGEIIYSA